MSIHSIQKILAEHFSQPLPDLHKRRIIFWHDEEAEFSGHIDELELADVKLLKLNNVNWFYAKKLLCHDDLDSDYLVYIPFSFKKPDDNWLRGLERQNEEFRADLHSMRMDELHMPQTVALRRAVKLYAKFFDSRERMEKIKAFGSLYNSVVQLHIDVLAVLCKANENTFSSVIKSFLSKILCDYDDELMSVIEKFGSMETFHEILFRQLGFDSGGQINPLNLAGYILVNALAVSFGKPSIHGLETLTSDSEQCRQNCFDLVSAWISSGELDFLYEIVQLAKKTYNISERLSVFEVQELTASNLLPCVDESILQHYYNEIIDGVIKIDEILSITEKRRTSVWFARYSSFYDGVMYIALMKQFLQQHAEGYHYADSADMFRAYCDDLYLMDTYYRHFHTALGRCIGNTDSDLEDLFKMAADHAENLYKNAYLSDLGNAWDNLISYEIDDDFKSGSIPKQEEFYIRKVKPAAENSRVFVIISDALRYEVAVELNEMLIRETKGTAALSAMQGVFPSITKCGMAALLPHGSVEMTENADILCDGKSCNTTEKRRKILQRVHKGNTAVSYNELISMKKAERRELIRDAKIVYIYHNTIDAIGDKAHTESQVFESCNDAINEIKALVRIIVNDMNGTRIFITADHGFIYTYKPLAESERVDSELVNGKIIECGHRYVIADSSSEYLTEIPLKKYNPKFKGFTPKGYMRIKKQGGGVNYVHGGMSLQEITVPVIEFRNLRVGQKDYVEARKVGLQLLSQSRRVSNISFNLDFYQLEAIGGKLLPNEFELYFSDESGRPVSDIQRIIADKTTDQVNERVFRKRFTMKNISFSKDEKYYLNIVEKDSGNCMERIEYKINIAFLDDFGF